MYFHLAESIRRVEIFCTKQGFAVVTHPFYNNVSFLRRCLQFPRQLYLFSKSYFRGYRTPETQSSIYDFLCNVPRTGYFVILLELPAEGTYSVMEKNG